MRALAPSPLTVTWTLLQKNAYPAPNPKSSRMPRAISAAREPDAEEARLDPGCTAAAGHGPWARTGRLAGCTPAGPACAFRPCGFATERAP